MEGGSTGSRSYYSPRRQAQARETRRVVLQAAGRLFRARGYHATTLPDVARAADVSIKTVYLSFPTKRQLLMAVWDLAIAGEGDQVPVVERDWFREILDESDPRRQLDLVAHHSRIVKQRVADVMEIIRNAAAEEPELAELWRTIQAKFYKEQHSVIRVLAGNGCLRANLTTTAATDLLWTLNHPNLFHLLVVERGWKPDRYQRWLATTLRQQLLPDEA